MLANSATELNAARLMVHHVARMWERKTPSILHGGDGDGEAVRLRDGRQGS